MITSKISFIALGVSALATYVLWPKHTAPGVADFTPSEHYDSCLARPTSRLAPYAHLTLAGEKVPLHRRPIRARLQHEVSLLLETPAQTQRMITRAKRHFKTIDPVLKRYGIPRDFRYVVAIESGFESEAVSQRGAAGIWQFMVAPAQEVGLTVNEEIDERLHPERSTVAACRYIKSMHRQTGSWTATLAAYNLGVNRWLRLVNRSGTTDYYRLCTNRETSRYVFKVLAFKEIMEHPLRYKLEARKPYTVIANADSTPKRTRTKPTVLELSAL